MSLTAEVRMPLAEVDNLRSTIKAGEQKIADLTKELTEVKADKRVMKITNTVYKSTGIDMYSMDNREIRRMFKYGTDHMSDHEITHRVKHCIRTHESFPIKQYGEKDDVEFINMDDVKEKLRDTISKEYEEEIRQLKSIQKRHEDQLRDVRDKYEKQLDDSTREQIKLVESYTGTIHNWQKRYEELEKGKKELSKIEELTNELKEVKEKLVKEQSKKWYHKLF